MKPIFIFFILGISFLLYTFSVYFIGGKSQLATHSNIEEQVQSGKLVWQKYNCQSCHQFYGLGGYLGPDITNLMSQEGKGPLFLKAMVEVGTKQMPSFKLSEHEMNDLTQFFIEMDKTGKSDPRNFQIFSSGMIKPNEPIRN